MLTEFERAHAASIADPNPVLAPIPPLQSPRILIASVIRKPPQVLRAWLQTLAWQRFREPAPTIDLAFITNFAPSDAFADDARAVLAQSGATIGDVPAPAGDYGDTVQTRAWTGPAFTRMAQLKNELIQRALDTRADYLFLCDADVLCDPYTLQSLLDQHVPIVSAVYWTNWQRPVPGATSFQHAGPQVWLRHPYFLDDERYSEGEFRDRLVTRQRTRVRGLGACTLISAEALRAGVSFARVDALPPGPMSEGEDRHFCARAQRLHIPMFADPWPDVYHAYHPAEYDEIPAMLERLYALHPTRPALGMLVNAKIEPLEPVTDALGRQMMLSAKYVRGRLGALNVLPQLEEAIGQLSVGDSTMVRVMYPQHFPLEWMRGQTRIARVTLLDAKPFRIAPTIDREVFVGTLGSVVDMTQLTPEQVGELQEGSVAT